MSVILGSGLNSPPDNPAGTPLIGYDNIITLSNITSTTEANGFPVVNLANPATHLYWKGGANTGSEFITVDNSGGGAVDYFAIAGHNLGSAQIPITVYDIGVSPNLVLVGPSVVVPDDRPVIIRFARSAYTFPTLVLEQSFLADGDVPRIAVVYCGSLLVLERGIKVDVEHVPITFGRKTSVVNGMSETGNFLGRIVLSESRASKAEFFGFTPTFYRDSVDPFLDQAQETPFFWAWAPQDYPLETGYAWLTGNPVPAVSPDHRRIALTLDMAGIA